MSIRGISEIVLVVKDVAAAAAFYREVIGLEPEGEPGENWAWFRMGPPDRPSRLAVTLGPLLFEEGSPRPPGRRWGPVHFALHTDRSELDTRVEHVRTNGAKVFGPTRFDWMQSDSYYCYDPDGNLVEFWSPDSH